MGPLSGWRGAGIDQGGGEEGAKPAGQHAGGRAFHGHAAPPDTHEEQREIAGGGDGEGLADHEIDLELFDQRAQQHGDAADQHGAPFEHLHALLRGGGMGRSMRP